MQPSNLLSGGLVLMDYGRRLGLKYRHKPGCIPRIIVLEVESIGLDFSQPALLHIKVKNVSK